MHRTATRPAALLFVTVLATACGGAGSDAATDPPVERVVSAADLAALPQLAVEDGTLLCTADGYDDCPLQVAVANRLDAERIAIWEPGRTIQLWHAADAAGAPLGHAGVAAGDYRTAVAVRAKGRGFEIVEADNGAYALLTLDADGRITGRAAIPTIGPQSVLGFVGDIPVRQEYEGWTSFDGGVLQVVRLRSPLDSTGTLLLSASIPWMRGGSAETPPLPPLIAATPSWTLTARGGVVWSPGAPFKVEGRGPGGVVEWTLTGPDGPPVTAEDVDQRERELRAANLAFPLNDEDYAQMRSRSDSIFPAVGGVTALANGDVIVAGANIPRDSAAVFYRLDAGGVPVARFTLDRRARILLAEGDSLLLHRPTEGEPWELRWARLRQPE